MAKRRWIGLRSPSFRRLLFIVFLVIMFCLGIWLGRRPADNATQKLTLLQQQLKQLEKQVEQLKSVKKN